MVNSIKKERARLAAERARRKRGVKQCKGIEAECIECSATYVRMVKHGCYCSDACRVEAARRRARERSNNNSRRRGAPKIGDEIECSHCKASFKRDAPRAKYCQSCRALQKKSALPSMREYNSDYRKTYHREKMKSDPVYAITMITRGSIRDAISRMGYTKRNRCHKILGCSWEFFKGYIEAKFQKGMTWENRGTGWELDHIIPISSAKTEDEVIKLNHYSNFQPLWKEQNREKGARLDWTPE